MHNLQPSNSVSALEKCAYGVIVHSDSKVENNQRAINKLIT